MAKTKKKRTKKYQGAEASTTRPTVTRMSAVSRRPLHQWLYERRRIIKSLAIALAVVAGIVLIIIGIMSLFV